MKTRMQTLNLFKVIFLILLLCSLKVQTGKSQPAQTGEFNVIKLVHQTLDSIDSCPKFTCQIDTVSKYHNASPSSSSARDSLVNYISSGIFFSQDKPKMIERITKQIDSIRSSIINLQVFEFNLKSTLKDGEAANLRSAYLLKNKFDSELNGAIRDLSQLKDLEFSNPNLNTIVQKLISNFNTRQQRLKANIAELNDAEKKLNDKKNEDLKKKAGISALPQIFDIIEQVKPSVTLLGSAQINNKGVHSIGAYIGNGQGDTLSVNSIIIPEFSKYGFYGTGYISLNTTFQNKYQGKFWLHYAIHAHEKSTYDLDNDKQLNFFRLQTRFGLEYFIFKDVLSTYYNFNWIKPFTNVESYRSNFNIPGYNQVFNDLGIRMFLKTDHSPIGGLGLFVDLNFIFLNDSFDRFNTQKDFVRPMIKAGLQANFR
ncbi:MAG: hypothetical protein IPK35_03440 [Saprospiraceae bacterium]|jgi:hypothetical protein|nr:hypothetical protein [Saprospiraceae bacterium]